MVLAAAARPLLAAALLQMVLGGGPATVSVSASGRRVPAPVERACAVFCQGPLLDAVQRAGIFEDSKTFVDRPLRVDPEEVLEAFSNLTNPADPEVLRQFVEAHFEPEGQELQPYTPSDYKEQPETLLAIRDADMREWALGLNRLWVVLCRMQDPAVAAAPQRYSALPQRFHTVVPGGRFRETYYWDTYWIIRGLLACEMVDTARGVTENLLDYVRAFGFVPNGGRAYYLDRSQPPMLSEMVLAVYDVVQDREWLAEVQPVLEDEYRFWMDPANRRVVHVTMPEGEDLVLNVFGSSSSAPRPESYGEDLTTATEAAKLHNRRVEDVYTALRAAAESGWDFSSRWLAAGVGGDAELSTINATAVVPVDLNCILLRVEQNLAKIERLLHGGGPAAAAHDAAATRRIKAMDAVLWSKADGVYRDFRLDAAASSKVVSLADFSAPLWAGLYGPGRGAGKEPEDAVAAVNASGLLQPGGALTTPLRTGQQWDSPNAWAPLQLMLVEGLDALRKEAADAAQLADDLADRWLQSCFKAWNATGMMYEKYDATNPGHGGGGGEYHPQVGFGWSNGVALSLLLRAHVQPAKLADPLIV